MLAYLFSFGVIGGFVYAAIAFGARAKAMKARRWLTVEGRVVRPANITPFGALGGGLRYSYKVNGKAYESGRIRLLDWPAFLWPDVGTVRAGLVRMQDVIVRVNPAAVEDAVLDTVPPPLLFAWVGLGIAFACLLPLLFAQIG